MLATLAVPASAGAAPPDVLDRGDYAIDSMQQVLLGTTTIQEPNSSGGAATSTGSAGSITLQVRGSMYRPTDRVEASPVIVIVHGNHSSCDSGTSSSTAECAVYKRNDAGYAFMGENLASWGYTVFSVDQDQLMLRQDTNKGKGMHQRRLLIAAVLDQLTVANEPGGIPVTADANIGTTLEGTLDMTRIGLMGHSRGGDAVTSFIDYNRTRTAPGARYPLRAVISLAPVDYERKAPYGMPYMSVLPWCDGDVSNLQGARFYERSQYIKGDDPFPRVLSSQLGAIHNWYNTVWFADGEDAGSGSDAACRINQPNNTRLSGSAGSAAAENYVIDNSEKNNPEVNTRISGDPARMGDQEKIGLATMNAFFRRYVGGEGALDPYMTGELSVEEGHLQIPESACPTSTTGTRMACKERVSTSYFAAPDERVDVIRPEIQNPLGLNSLGGKLSGSGFANPYVDNGGVSPYPSKTAGGYDWCNPEPDHFANSQLGLSTQPTGAKACPLPGKAELGGQNGIRENAPVNHSYGRQLSLAWEADQDAKLTADIPAASSDMSGLKSLTMGADVNFFDTRNPERTGTDAEWNPELTTQDFIIALVDTDGNEGTVHAGNEDWGNALHQSTGSSTARMHIVLDQIRVPLSVFEAQGVDISSLDELEFRFGEDGTPQSGSIQVADVRFQEADSEPLVLSDGVTPNAGAGSGPPATGPDPAVELAEYDRSPGNLKLVDTTGKQNSNTTWLVDDDGVECPAANFSSIQSAIDYASPWDTIVVCAGVYKESSAPTYHAANPIATGSMNGLTINKPLKIKGAGASKVTIMPDPAIGDSLAGAVPYLRDGGGNVITISRQSLGSTDTNEHFVDISGVTVTSGSTYAEAGVAYFNAAGRISESVIGPMTRASTAQELADQPHGWGVIKTVSILGDGPGTVENEVTVENSVVTGYQSGGILIDGARGTDGSADNSVRTGIKSVGYVENTVVRGKGSSSLIPQTGIKFASGAKGFVKGSRITGNFFNPDQRQSVGILLTDAATEVAGSWFASGNVITGNGYALFNANADNTGVRESEVGVPTVALATGNYWGPSAPVSGPSSPTTAVEGISGVDALSVATVSTGSRLTSVPATVPTGVGALVDEAPTGAIIDPVDDTELEVGEELTPIVRAADDFAVESVMFVVDGELAGKSGVAPYEFSWTPDAEDAGRELVLTALVTDSSGQVTTTGNVTVSVAEAVGPTGPTGPTSPTGPTGETTPTGPTGDTTPPIEFTPKVTFGKVTKKSGVVYLSAKVNSGGIISVTGSKVVNTVKKPGKAKTIKLVVKPKAKYRKVLRKKGKLKVKATIKFSSTEGGQVTKKRTITVVKKK
ncbi:MAG: Ig-like domain-containing protein [Solirubrobacterales bacterium]